MTLRFGDASPRPLLGAGPWASRACGSLAEAEAGTLSSGSHQQRRLRGRGPKGPSKLPRRHRPGPRHPRPSTPGPRGLALRLGPRGWFHDARGSTRGWEGLPGHGLGPGRGTPRLLSPEPPLRPHGARMTGPARGVPHVPGTVACHCPPLQKGGRPRQGGYTLFVPCGVHFLPH